MLTLGGEFFWTEGDTLIVIAGRVNRKFAVDKLREFLVRQAVNVRNEIRLIIIKP